MIEVDWRVVPAGPFRMGSDPGARLPARSRREPRGTWSRWRRSGSAGSRSRTRSTRRSCATRGIAAPSSWPDGTVPAGQTTCPSPTSPGTTRARSAPGPAGGCRPRSSGRRRRAAATTGSGRGATMPPDRTRAMFAPASAGPRSPGSCTARQRPAARSTWRATSRVDGERVRALSGRRRRRGQSPSRVSCAAARTSTGQTSSAARRAGRCTRARSTTTSASASRPIRARP